jgi:hypothetical protein
MFVAVFAEAFASFPRPVDQGSSGQKIFTELVWDPRSRLHSVVTSRQQRASTYRYHSRLTWRRR